MTAIFDGLAEIFTDPSVFGEAVVYTPLATGVPVGANGTINAIWHEGSLDVAMTGADSDAAQTTLHVRAADVPEPLEGDVARRVQNGRVMKVSTPILPDGKGMIRCNLAAE
jgi:hypothetical protein